jgi:hypothetical protein
MLKNIYLNESSLMKKYFDLVLDLLEINEKQYYSDLASQLKKLQEQ